MTQDPAQPPPGRPDGLATLNVALDQLATETGDPDRLPDRAQRVLEVGQLRGRLDGQGWPSWPPWTPPGRPGPTRGRFGATAGWLRQRRHLSPAAPPAPSGPPRALFRGPSTRTAQAVTNGELSPAHAQVLAAGTHDLPSHTTTEAEPILVEAARRLDPPRRRRPSQPLDVGRTTRVATRPNAPPWRSATGAVSSPAASGPARGVRPISWSRWLEVARPTWPTWPCAAGPTTGPS